MNASKIFNSLADLEAALADGNIPDTRVQKVDLAGQTVWIKQPESLSPRMFLQKGNAKRAFAAEQAAHIKFASMGLPVAELLLTSPCYTVTGDIGGDLRTLMRKTDHEQSAAIISKAAAVLAQFHTAGTYHGRPNLKDICWDGAKISFLDFERADAHSDAKRGMIEDVIMFVFNIFAEAKGDYPPLVDIMQIYRNHAPAGIWDAAVTRANRYKILGPLTWPIRQKKKAWEFKAIPRTLEFFESQTLG